MKLATFTHAGETRLGVVKGEAVIDLKAVAPDLPTEMCNFLAAGADALTTARSAAGR
ncbi:MAG: 5-carboxymethyl-2-hydroxymuconate isomerase, partial [Deltaproteobacteria bacterium]